MSNTMSKPGLDPIEHASIDELRALQLERLKWTLKHAYDNVPHYKKAFDEAGVHPDDLKQLSDISKFPFTTKKELRENYPFGMFAVPRERISRIHASSGTTGKPTVVGYTKGDLDNWPIWWRARSAPPAASGRHRARGLWLRPVHGRAGAHYGAERLGCTVIPMSGGQTEKQVQLINDFRPDIIMVTPSYFCNILEEQRRQGLIRVKVRCASASSAPSPDRPDARRHRGRGRHRRGGHLRPVGSDGAGRGQRMRRDQGRSGRLGRPLLRRDHQPRHRRARGRRRTGRTGVHLADQAMPIVRYRAGPDLPVAAHRAQHAPHRQDHRPQRRHADRARREHVPDAGRGTGAEDRPAGAALPAGAVAYRQYGRAGNPDRGARRVLDAVRRGPRGAGASSCSTRSRRTSASARASRCRTRAMSSAR